MKWYEFIVSLSSSAIFCSNYVHVLGLHLDLLVLSTTLFESKIHFKQRKQHAFFCVKLYCIKNIEWF